ncbi:MAG TPA: MBL fold metallo-hydrolase [Candidatus Acidoferrum sp.]|nr:MBL fold metallo-hydrolase [Candidatus Acidoferrum sp.]
MLVRFHGVRGSSPTCDLRTWRYGGNTPCVEVETPAGHRIILDGGTGLRSLGRTVAPNAPASPFQATFLLSHYLWDHIQGLPFFLPLYDLQNRFEFFGLQPEDGAKMESVLQGQMIRPYFPVDLSVLAAARSFTAIGSGTCWQVGDATIETASLYHPQGSLGFRIETEHGVVTYSTDTEPGDPVGDQNVRHLARGADVLIYDAQFSPALLERRRGWGHSSWTEAIAVARDAGVRCLILFHHDPDSNDASVDRFVQLARDQWPRTWGAAEGYQVSCRTPEIRVETSAPRVGPRVPARLPVRLRGQRADGSPIEHEGFISNLSLKGTFVVVPEPLDLNSEVEIVLMETENGEAVMTGQVVRVGMDQETGQPAIGVVFPVEKRRLRRIAGPEGPEVDETGALVTPGETPP